MRERIERWHRAAAWMCAGVLLGSACLLSAQAAFPDTPSARQFAAWLAAFNSGNRDTYTAFIKENYPSAGPRIEGGLRLREQTGGFDLKKVEDATPTKLVALVQERLSDQFARLTLDLDAAEPHRIAVVSIQAIARPAEFALPHLSEVDLVAELREKVEAEAAADRFAGAVLWTRQGKTMFAGAYGLADRDRRVHNALNTRLRIGSMNKMFTATAVLQLVQAGKVKLDAPLGTYLPDYPNKETASTVTIEHLLTHTGGTGDIFGPGFDAHRMELRTLQDYVKLYGNERPRYEPGSRWEYSNYGFILLGIVIEKASGENYYDYVRDHVYTAAGMTATGDVIAVLANLDPPAANRVSEFAANRLPLAKPSSDKRD